MEDLGKAVKKYTRLYRSAIQRRGLSDVEGKTRAYQKRLGEMYASEQFAKHNVYPSMWVPKVYAVIAMCLELRDAGLEKDDTLAVVCDAFRGLKGVLRILERIVDATPWAWAVVKKWNNADHDSRVRDGSITFDFFTSSDDKIAYSICECQYVNMFACYGIREYCKVFCNSDISAYANLTRHIQFIRHSDLSDGCCCHDEILRK